MLIILYIIEPNQSLGVYFKTLKKYKFKMPEIAITAQAKQPFFNKLLDNRKQSDYEMVVL